MPSTRSAFAVVLLFAAACAPARRPAIPSPPPRVTATMPALAVPATALPTAAVAPATPTVTAPPPTPTLPAAADRIAHLAPGTAITVTTVAMIDVSTGWAVGGAGQVGDHVLHTTDGGLTWADRTPPEPAALAGEFGFVIDAHGFFRDAESAWVLYGVTDTRQPTAIPVWRTVDAGRTWTTSAPIDASDLGVSDFFAPSDLHFTDDQHGWFLAHLGVGMNHDYIAVYHTADGGATWAPVLTPQASESPQSCGKTGLRFMDARRGWLTGDCQGVAPGLFFYQSADAGATWQPVVLPAPDDQPELFTRLDAGCGTNSLTVFDAQTVKLSVACLLLDTDPLQTVAYVYTTGDGGQTWTHSRAPSRGLTFINPQVGWSLPLTFGFNNPPFAIEHTTDGGLTWTPRAQVDWYGQPDFVDAQNGWNVAYTPDAAALVRTTDGGATWQLLDPVIAP